MRPPDTTFDKVKSLLRRMDSSIDEARQRRKAREASTQSNPINSSSMARNAEAQAIRNRLAEMDRND
ncbi:MAG TPA: hypothetical protein ENJ06_04140 [Phycisphaeraceae bacterium]|nr:hypothetical protein [Phycisphaeraceae bacterium]